MVLIRCVFFLSCPSETETTSPFIPWLIFLVESRLQCAEAFRKQPWGFCTYGEHNKCTLLTTFE